MLILDAGYVQFGAIETISVNCCSVELSDGTADSSDPFRCSLVVLVG
jgi:hypothetical protein